MYCEPDVTAHCNASLHDAGIELKRFLATCYIYCEPAFTDGPDIVGAIQFELKTAPNVDPPVFQLTCTSSTAPATTVQWSKDGSPVSGGSSSQIVTNRTEATYINELTVTRRQSGTYNCTVTTWRAYRDDDPVEEDTMVDSPATASITVEGMYIYLTNFSF